jgi:hypothetical protein
MTAPENTRARAPVAAPAPRPSLFVALACLPVRARVLLLVVCACAALPAAFSIYGLVAGPSETGIAAFLGRQPLLVTVAAIILALAALVIFEQPETGSPGAYLTQLRARAATIHSEYVAALARRLPPSGDPS